MKRILRDYQNLLISHFYKYKRAAGWVFMGGGKTAAVLHALRNLALIDDVFPTLIIGPLRVVQSTWPDELNKWEEFYHYKISVLTGAAGERATALKKKADFYAINFDNLPWLIKTLNGGWPFKTTVVDEARKLKGFRLRQGTARAKALASVAFRSERFWELTGTPTPKGFEDLWGQLYFLDRGQRLGKTYTAFMNRWFDKGYDGFTYTPKSTAQPEIEGLIKDICLSIDASKYFPTDKPIEIEIPVKLPALAMRQYKAMEKEMFAEVGKHQIEAFNAAAKTMKCLQFANGAVYTDNKGSWTLAHDEKIKALESIAEESGGAPLLVAYHFKSDLERLKRAFPYAKVLDKDAKTVKDWNKGKFSMMLVHPASAGHGLDLHHSCNILVFYSVNWDLELHQQVIERIGPARQKQGGYDRSVFIYYILAEGTIDHLVMERLKTKKTVQEILMQAMARQ